MFRKIGIIILIIFIGLLLYNNVQAKESTKSTIIREINSGRILYENNSHDKKLIASITNIMTT